MNYVILIHKIYSFQYNSNYLRLVEPGELKAHYYIITLESEYTNCQGCKVIRITNLDYYWQSFSYFRFQLATYGHFVSIQTDSSGGLEKYHRVATYN